MAEKKIEKEHIVKIYEVGYATHDVKVFIVEKPEGYTYTPGQATEVSINNPEIEKEKRPFTFTSQPENPYLEFTIKMYEDHEDGMTKHLRDIKGGDELTIRDSWGAIHYEGPGTFIAGGAGITPFIAILRSLRKKNKLQGNKLLFSNRTTKDIINQYELEEMLKENCKFIITNENTDIYETGMIDEKYLRKNISNFDQHFYICGPKKMVEEIQKVLQKIGVNSDKIIVEEA